MGKKCYEILQAGGCACAICNNEALEEGQFIEWQYYNPVLQKHYMDRMMADSEKLMYEDKAAYYREKGIDRRR